MRPGTVYSLGKEVMEMKNDGGRGKGHSRHTDTERQKVETVLKAKCTPEMGGHSPRN